MAQLFGISGEQVDRIRPLFPKEPGVKRVDAPARLWSPQNPRQPLPPLVRQGCF